MKKKIILLLLLSVVISVSFLDAGKHPDAVTVTPLKFVIPPGWPKPPTNIFANNPLTEEGFQLGKKLFYDGRLSKDGSFSCASCHQQFAAFATFEHDFSHGFNNGFTTRNAPPLFNIAWMKELQWDGGINHIEVQPLAPMTAPNEMAENLDSVLIKIKNDEPYRRMFKAAFGNNVINSQRLLKALAQFVGSIVSSNAKYDKVKRGEAKFTITEENGYAVFRSKCESCHKEPLFTDNSFRNNGLAINPMLQDFGRMKISGNKNDSLKFKVPTLRNIIFTYPYMHDGRFFTLGQVIKHYTTNIQKSPTLDTVLQNGITLTKPEQNEIIVFLATLSDSSLINNPRFAEGRK